MFKKASCIAAIQLRHASEVAIIHHTSLNVTIILVTFRSLDHTFSIIAMHLLPSLSDNNKTGVIINIVVCLCFTFVCANFKALSPC